MTTAHDVQIPEWTRGDRMRKSLESQGISVAEAAVKFGVSRTTISNWIHDRSTPSLTERREWATWTEVPLAWLETGQAGPTNGPGLTVVAGTGFEPVTSGLLATVFAMAA